MSRWIKCSKKLPEQDERVLVLDCHGYQWVVRLAEMDRELYWTDGDLELEFEEVTHWMPLPEPPKEEREIKERKAMTCETCKHNKLAIGALQYCARLGMRKDWLPDNFGCILHEEGE